jgi:hypothetical protein
MNEQEVKRLLKLVSQFSDQMAAKIDGLVSTFSKDVDTLQRRLLQRLLSEFVPEFETSKGVLLYNKRNILLMARIDGVMNEFERSFLTGRLSQFAADLVSVSLFVKEYYIAIGQTAAKVEAISESLGLIEATIGIRNDGTFIAGGYLDRLGQTAQVRQDLQRYVLQSLGGKSSLKDYTNGLQALVVGNKDTDGTLQRYFRQYAYDSFNQVSEVANKQMADELGFKYFIYEGSIIDTSRNFCRSKAGKVFSTDEAKEWKRDPDLLGDPATYINPLIERGRWNCRHMIRYIPIELAQALRSEIK